MSSGIPGENGLLSRMRSSATGYPTRVVSGRTPFTATPLGLLTNPGGASAIARQVVPYQSRGFPTDAPSESLASDIDTFTDVRQIPESEPNTNAITRWNRTAKKLVIPITKQITLEYEPPKATQLVFLWRRNINPHDRLSLKSDARSRVENIGHERDPFPDSMRTERDHAARLGRPLRMHLYHQVTLLGLEQLNHLLACLEAARMVNAGAFNGADGPNNWARFKEEQHLSETISKVMSWFSFEGVPFESSIKPLRGHMGEKGRQLTMVGSGRAHMVDIFRGVNAAEHHYSHLLFIRCEIDLTKGQQEGYRFATRQSEFESQGFQNIQPNPYKHGVDRTYKLFPVQCVPVSVPSQGALPSWALAYKSYDNERFVDGKSNLIGRIYHTGYETAGGDRPGRSTATLKAMLAKPMPPRDAYLTQTGTLLEMTLHPTF